jgi:cytochrome c5
MKKVISILFISGLVVFSCKKEKAEEPTTTLTTTVSFATDVQPIFQQSCGTGGSCHGTSSGADGKVYETHAGATAVPDGTTLGEIKHTAGFKPMPQGGTQLSSDKISKIESWISGGKKND